MTVVKLKTVKGARARLPQPPAHVAADPVAAETWAATVKALHPKGRLPPERLPLLENYCLGVSLLRSLTEAMQGQPLVLPGPNGFKAHPLVSPRNRAAANLTTMASRLGLVISGPGTGSDASASGDDAAADPYDDLGI